MLPIRIAVGDLSLDGELNDTDGARSLARALPLTAAFRVWGDELHIDVAIVAKASRPDATVSPGDLGLSLERGTLCIFFGPTPMSPDEDPVSAIPVTVVGRLDGAEALRAEKEAGRITIEAANGNGGRGR